VSTDSERTWLKKHWTNHTGVFLVDWHSCCGYGCISFQASAYTKSQKASQVQQPFWPSKLQVTLCFSLLLCRNACLATNKGSVDADSAARLQAFLCSRKQETLKKTLVTEWSSGC